MEVFPHSLSSRSLESNSSSETASPIPLEPPYKDYDGKYLDAAITFSNSIELKNSFEILLDKDFNSTQKITLVVRRDLTFFMVKCPDNNIAYFGLFGALVRVLFAKDITHEFSCENLLELLKKKQSTLIMMIISKGSQEIAIHYGRRPDEFDVCVPLTLPLTEIDPSESAISNVCKQPVQKTCFPAKYLAEMANHLLTNEAATSEPVSVIFTGKTKRHIHMQVGEVAMKMPKLGAPEYHAKFILPFWKQFSKICDMAKEFETGLLHHENYNYYNFNLVGVGIFTFYIRVGEVTVVAKV